MKVLTVGDTWNGGNALFSPSDSFLGDLCHSVCVLLQCVQVAVNDSPPQRAFWKWEGTSHHSPIFKEMASHREYSYILK